jgi:hypothetical protein
VLTDRLNRLVDEGILRRRLYQERPERYEYRLTRKGVGLWPMMMTTMKWGDRYLYPDGHPRLVLHKDCGGEIDERLHCSRCGAELGPTDVYVESGPVAGSEAA